MSTHANSSGPDLPPQQFRAVGRLQRLCSPLFCSTALLLCIWVANPFANAGFNDDWAYAHVALKLAETGHIYYGGCCNAMILFQSFWGAIWIHFLGFSFDLLRIITVPFSIGFVLLIYALGRKIGLPRNLALFGSLIVGSSPLFLPMAASFMTEPYACFFSTLCIYAAICSAEAASKASAMRWLWVLAAAGIFGGSDRQTVWAAPMALIPYLFWIRRSDRRFSIHAAGLFGACICCLIFFVLRFSQPYAPVLSRQGFVSLILNNSAFGLGYLISLLLASCLMTWPALLCITPLWKSLEVAEIGALGAVSAVLTVISIFVGSNFGVVPFLGNIVSPVGVLYAGQDALGFRPIILPLLFRVSLTCFLIFNILITSDLYKTMPGKLSRISRDVFTIFAFTYIPFLFPGALLGLTFDRYALPVFPVIVISILLALTPRVQRVPLSAWACLFIFTGYSVTTTHDYFSALRARVRAAETLENLGIPRSHISAGLEYDGWTQLEVAGRMEAVEDGRYPHWNTTDTFGFWGVTKAVQPDYVARYSRVADPYGRRVLSIPFTTWMPPFRRFVVIKTRADLGK